MVIWHLSRHLKKRSELDCKTPEAEARLAHLLNSKKAGKAEAGCTKDKIVEDKIRAEVGD